MADELPREFFNAGIGLHAAWLAIADRGRSDAVRSAALAAPGASRSDSVVRTAIRATAADWVETVANCRPLAKALRSIVIADGVLRYLPGGDAPEIDVGL